MNVAFATVVMAWTPPPKLGAFQINRPARFKRKERAPGERDPNRPYLRKNQDAQEQTP